MKHDDDDTFYRALVNRDRAYEGIFFAGVTTTGIFCRSTCTSKKPNRENVVFFKTAREALAAGFRPCKNCRPMEPAGETPEWAVKLLKLVEAEPLRRLKTADLRKMGLSPEKVRRWFNREFGMTFHTFARMLRMNAAFGLMQSGKTVTDTAFESGFESLSGFSASFEKTFSRSPSATPKENKVTQLMLRRISTPLGTMVAAVWHSKLVILEFADRRALETEIGDCERLLATRAIPGSDPLFETIEAQLNEYFAGELVSFDLPLHTPGTAFQQTVWNQLRTIPYGSTRSYKEQAIAIGKPTAVRAVASANGDNRIAIIIPCHRVIGSSGELVGYGGGLYRKQYLLDLEKRVVGKELPLE